MQVKRKTIMMSKVRRHLRTLARNKYDGVYSQQIEKDVRTILEKIYYLFNQYKREIKNDEHSKLYMRAAFNEKNRISKLLEKFAVKIRRQ